MDDFYQQVGLTDDFKSGLITHVQQIHMERKNCDSLSGIMIATLKKDKKYKLFTDRHINTVAGMECMNYSPVSNDNVPDNEIWVFEKPTSPNDTAV